MFYFLRSKSFALAIILPIALAACNNTSTPDNPSASTAPTNNAPATSQNSNKHSEKKPVSNAVSEDVDYMTKLGLMKGHMLVAKELLDLQKLDQAEPHIGHPVEEIYADVENQLKQRNVPEFKNTLNTLHDLVKAKSQDTKKIEAAFQASMQAVDKAIEAVPQEKRESTGFVLPVINGLLDTANSEYKAAIANDKIAEAIEYQDSRGFVLYADTLYKGIADKMAKEHPEADKAIASNMTQLKTAWPNVVPPAKPVLTPEQVSQSIQAIEQNNQKVVNATPKKPSA